MSDPLASPTLAQLYLAQGLHDRASTILEQLLDSNARDPTALALRRRLRVRAPIELLLEAVRNAVRAEIVWPGTQRLHPDDPLSVVLSVWSTRRASPWITSRPCVPVPEGDDHETRVEIPLPPVASSGWATACLVRRRPGESLRVLAVSEPCGW